MSTSKQHGSLPEQPLSPEARRHYVTQWVTAQKQFENRIAALSVHHADYVQGFGSLYAAAP